MKKTILTLFIIITFVNLSIAGPKKIQIITLKGGSVLKGKVLQLQDGIYTIDVLNLGQMSIPESNILSITSTMPPEAQYQDNSVSQKAQLKNQINQIQGGILSNPELMMDVQNILNDEEVQMMLSDPQLLNDILSYDPEKIQQNTNVQSLMQNQKMQQLMNKIQQQVPSQ